MSLTFLVLVFIFLQVVFNGVTMWVMNLIQYFKNLTLSNDQLIEFGMWVLFSLTVYFASIWLLRRVLTPVFARLGSKWGSFLIKNGVIDRASLLMPAFIFLAGVRATLPFSENTQIVFERLTISTVIIVLALVLSSIINALFDISQHIESTKDKPLKSIAQATKMVVFVFAFILILSTTLNQSPWVFISGIGAMTAVVLLIFKDSILGLVSGIQLSVLDMVRVGDWIEVPAHGVDGDVMDITLNTVKVRNFDQTITTLPPTFLTGQVLINYHGMVETGARRIKRSIMVDQSSIAFADKDMIAQWQKIHLLQTYISDKQREISLENQKNPEIKNHPMNERALTNIGTFRKYVEFYLKSHPRIAQNMIAMARQLQPTAQGLPLEVYAFVNSTQWLVYEEVQSDIFDHLLSSLPSFGLRIFQNPAGFDFKQSQNLKTVLDN